MNDAYMDLVSFVSNLVRGEGMTESEWLSSSDPQAMLGEITAPHNSDLHVPGWRASDRKLRLFACACLALSNQDMLRNTDTYGRFNYGEEGKNIRDADLPFMCRDWCRVQNDYDPTPEVKANLLRDIVGNPWRPTIFAGKGSGAKQFGGKTVLPRTYLTTTVLSLATAAYEERGRECEECGGDGEKDVKNYHGAWEMWGCSDCRGTGRIEDGTLDPLRLAILADALTDAGCDNEDILAHLRSPGPHVRGCHVVDLLTGRE